MADTDIFSDLEIYALTLIGEAEDMGGNGMEEVANVIQNRKKANLKWMGGNDERSICLQYEQFSCWNAGNNSDRERIINIGKNNPLYIPYVSALSIANRATQGLLADGTNNAVSYINHNDCMPLWAEGKTPCHINEPVWYYDLSAVV